MGIRGISKNLKKSTFGLVAVALALSLIACGQPADTVAIPSEQAPGKTTSPTPGQNPTPTPTPAHTPTPTPTQNPTPTPTPTPTPPRCSSFFCLKSPGQFFVSTANTPENVIVLKKQGHYTRVHIEFDIEIPAWYVQAGFTNKAYPLFYLTKNGKWKEALLGYGLLYGNGANNSRLRWGFGMSAADKYNASQRIQATAPNNYHIVYDYDAINSTVRLNIQSSNGNSATLIGSEGIVSVDLSSKDQFELVIGQDLTTSGPEAPTFGWKYSNLSAELN